MPNINLLPWREEYIIFKNKIFLTIAGVIIASCAGGVYMVGLQIKKMATKEQLAAGIIRKEGNRLETVIKEIKGLQEQKIILLERRDVIQALQASRPFIVKVFDGIARAVPTGLHLNIIRRTGKRLTINGFSESNAKISEFMKILNKMDWLTETNLREIKHRGSFANEDATEFLAIEFTLIVTLTYS